MDYTKFAKQFMHEMHMIQKNRPKIDVTEMSQGRPFILRYLLERGTAVLPSEISGEMGISTARIAAALNNLERNDLINREIDKNDRRQILVTLTDKGRELAAGRENEILNHLAAVFSELGEVDAKEFVRIFSKFVEIMERHKMENHKEDHKH